MTKTLKDKILDAAIDGIIGKKKYPAGIRLNTKTLIQYFLSGDHKASYLKSFLANSEMNSKTDYYKFVVRIPTSKGEYVIHPNEILAKMQERQIV
ncbi:MAG: hypothetical protein CVU31_17940 [Betaproteobacteria bacterium HGW-Betaproteobacteria-4]|jgi:S-formylglutathione hydrolase FrmB|nr:MAG: hypothetical protein CVU31_17940 [Betaproteobacteria bacterium HGW-Betaproteobacteria-4]